MSETIQADPALFPSIAYYYESQCNDLMAIKEFVVSNCTLDDAFGLLLSVMKPQYEEARDKTMGGMDTIASLLRTQATAVNEYAEQLQADEDAMTQTIKDLEARVAELEAQAAANAGTGGTGGSGSGGSGSGGYGGGSGGGSGGSGGGSGGTYTGGSGDVSGGVNPGDDVTSDISNDGDNDGNSNDGDDDGDINITITGDNNTVTIGEDGEVTVEGEAEVETPETETPTTETPTAETPATETTTETPTETTPTDGVPVDPTAPTDATGNPITEPVLDENGLPVDPDAAVLDPAVVAAENAQRAELYDQIWEEQAANDPLGRSADELRLAWEAKQPIELDATSTASASIGYAAPAPQPIPVNFSLFADANVRPQALIGARS